MKTKKHFDDNEFQTLRSIIDDKTGYAIRDEGLLSQAFRRRSFCAVHGGKSNEMLEFIGDRAVSYYAVQFFAGRCCVLNVRMEHSFCMREDRMNDVMERLVNNEAFAKIIDEWGVAPYLIVGQSDLDNRVDQEVKVKADLFEAIIGAIALDCSWNEEILRSVVRRALRLEEQWEAVIREDDTTPDFDLDNAVSTLKELAEKEICEPPLYEVSEEALRDGEGRLLWRCVCATANDLTSIRRRVYAPSKKEAKRAAAYLVLCEHFQTPNRYGPGAYRRTWVCRDGRLEPCKIIKP